MLKRKLLKVGQGGRSASLTTSIRSIPIIQSLSKSADRARRLNPGPPTVGVVSVTCPLDRSALEGGVKARRREPTLVQCRTTDLRGLLPVDRALQRGGNLLPDSGGHFGLRVVELHREFPAELLDNFGSD